MSENILLLPRSNNINMIRYIAILAIVIFTITSCANSKKYVAFDYEVYDFKDILTEEPVYLDSVKIGKIKSINYDSTTKKCYGKLNIMKANKLYSNMIFTHQVPFIGFPSIKITVDKNMPGTLLNPGKDKIRLVTKVE